MNKQMDTQTGSWGQMHREPYAEQVTTPKKLSMVIVELNKEAGLFYIVEQGSSVTTYRQTKRQGVQYTANK